MRSHEIDLIGRTRLRGKYQVAFTAAPLVINDNHDIALPVVVDDLLYV
jgi:hypothetical protein